MKIQDRLKFFQTYRRIHLISVLLAVIAILYLRKPDAFTNPQFWAEDGPIFFHQSHVFGLKSFLMPYAGYLHTIPRIIAYLTSFFPMCAGPAIYNYSALGLLLFTCGYIFNSRLDLSHKTGLALAVALVPYNCVCYLNLTNVQWVLAPLLLMLVLQSNPRRKRDFLSDFSIITLLGLTGPFIILTLPLYAFNCIRNRNRYKMSVFLWSAILVLIQIFFLVTTGKERGDLASDFEKWLSLLAHRGSGDLFLGRELVEQVPLFVPATFTVILPLVLLTLAGTRRSRLQTVSVFVYFASAGYAATLLKHRGTPLALTEIGHADGYFYLPYLLIIWSLLQCLGMTRIKGWIAAILLAIILTSTIRVFKAEPFVDYSWLDHCRKINSSYPIRIPLNPPGWSIQIKEKSN